MSLFWIIVAIIYGIGLVAMIYSYVAAEEVPPELEDLFWVLLNHKRNGWIERLTHFSVYYVFGFKPKSL